MTTGGTPGNRLVDIGVRCRFASEGLGFAVLGCGIGLGGALLTARLIQTELYAVHSRDPLTYAAAVAVILAGAVLACLVPARRAMTVSPMDALRSE